VRQRRWAKLVAPRVGKLNCVDASAQALEIARGNLTACSNCCFHHASLDACASGGSISGFRLIAWGPSSRPGHACGTCQLCPEAQAARRFWSICITPSTIDRSGSVPSGDYRICFAETSKLPYALRYSVSRVMASPSTGRWLDCRIGRKTGPFNSPFSPCLLQKPQLLYDATDALDRFGTRLEKRFTKAQTRQIDGGRGFTGLRSASAPRTGARSVSKRSA